MDTEWQWYDLYATGPKGPQKVSLGQPAGKNLVAPIKMQVAPLCRDLLWTINVYDYFMTHGKMKWDRSGIRNIETNEKSYISGKKTHQFCTLDKMCTHTYSRIVSKFPILRGKSIFQRRWILFAEERTFNTSATCVYTILLKWGGICSHSFQNFGGKLAGEQPWYTFNTKQMKLYTQSKLLDSRYEIENGPRSQCVKMAFCINA